jgi:pimeloyl-ACP methyl ester carboxylesterase
MQFVYRILKSLLVLFFAVPLFAAQGKMARANGIDIWYETFGEKENPPLLLVMGSMCGGTFWPSGFCEQLSSEGFYVIRYDHRDSGFSTCFDFHKEPYDLLDMAKDAVGLLDALKIEKANICGLSMGGPIAELMAIHFPERVQSLTLMAASSDFRPVCFTVEKKSTKELSLPPPTREYIQCVENILFKSQDESEKLEHRIESWTLLNGALFPFEEKQYREIFTEFLQRSKYPEALQNHVYAIKNSLQLILDAPFQVNVPTAIIHGTEDPIFFPIHGETLASSIPNSKFVLVEGFGHALNSHFYPLFIEEIKAISQN